MPNKKWPLIILIGIIAGTILCDNRYLLLRYSIKTLCRVNIQWAGNTRQKMVALTFDDGPDPRYTPGILKILKKYRAPAAFFVEGDNALKYPGLLLDEYQSGYEIGNHTFSHPHLAALSVDEVQAELKAADNALRMAAGVKTSLFRPPYEELSENILTASRRSCKSIILSTITLEHESVKTPRAMAGRVVERIYPGAIILMHDGRLDRGLTVKALPYLLEALKGKGYRVVPVKRLLSENS